MKNSIIYFSVTGPLHKNWQIFIKTKTASAKRNCTLLLDRMNLQNFILDSRCLKMFIERTRMKQQCRWQLNFKRWTILFKIQIALKRIWFDLRMKRAMDAFWICIYFTNSVWISRVLEWVTFKPRFLHKVTSKFVFLIFRKLITFHIWTSLINCMIFQKK